MAALTKDRNTRLRAQATHRHRTRKVAVAKCIKGGIAAINAAGFLLPASDSAALVVVGIFEETVDNSGGSAGDKSCSYVTGCEAELENASGAIVQAARKAYVKDDQSVTTAAVALNDLYVGAVSEFTTTKAWVFIDEDVNTATNPLPLVNASVSPAVAQMDAAGRMVLPIPNAATADYDFIVPRACEIVDITVLKEAAGAGNTMQAKNGAGTAISDAIAAAVDKAVTRAGTLDIATRVLAAGATLRIAATNAAGSTLCKVIVHTIPR